MINCFENDCTGNIFSLQILMFLLQVKYLNEDAIFSPEQVMAMLLTELKTTAESNLSTKVVDCVISVSRSSDLCMVFI